MWHYQDTITAEDRPTLSEYGDFLCYNIAPELRKIRDEMEWNDNSKDRLLAVIRNIESHINEIGFIVSEGWSSDYYRSLLSITNTIWKAIDTCRYTDETKFVMTVIDAAELAWIAVIDVNDAISVSEQVNIPDDHISEDDDKMSSISGCSTFLLCQD